MEKSEMELTQRMALNRAAGSLNMALGDAAHFNNLRNFKTLTAALLKATAIDDMGMLADSDVPVLKDFSRKAALLGDAIWADGDVALMVRAFIESNAPSSVLDALAAYAVALPSTYTAGLVASGFTADAVVEGGPKGVYPVDLSKLPTEPSKAAGIVVVSDQLLGTAAGERVYHNELNKAVLRAVNTAVLNIALQNSPTAQVGGGATLAGLRAALAASQPSTGFVVVASSAAVAAFATLSEARGTHSLRGGELFPGVWLVPHDNLPAGAAMIVVAASNVVLADHGTIFRPARHANVQMSATPASSPNAATVFTSLWQHNYVALLVERSFRLGIPDGAVVVVED
jgi:hypothetical protein